MYMVIEVVENKMMPVLEHAGAIINNQYPLKEFETETDAIKYAALNQFNRYIIAQLSTSMVNYLLYKPKPPKIA